MGKQAYRPPGARDRPATVKPLDGAYEAAGHVRAGVAGVVTSCTNVAQDQPISKSAAKNKKRKEAAKRAAVEADPSSAKPQSSDQKDALQAARDHKYVGKSGMLADPAKDKKVRKLNDKLAAIKKLKL